MDHKSGLKTYISIILFFLLLLSSSILRQKPATIASSRTSYHRTYVIWASPHNLPKSALSPLRQIARGALSIGPTTVLVYCGSSKCVTQVLALGIAGLSAELIHLPRLLETTPFQTFVAHNPYYKLRLGSNFLLTLEWVIALSALDRRPRATVVNLRTTDSYTLDTLRNFKGPWIAVPQKNSSLGRWTPFLATTVFPEFQDDIEAWRGLIARSIPVLPRLGDPFAPWDGQSEVTSLGQDLLAIKEADDHKNNRVSVHQVPIFRGHHTPQDRFATLSSDTRAIVQDSYNFAHELESFAGLQFLPHVTDCVDPDRLTRLNASGDEPILVFGSGDYTQQNMEWPPDDRLTMLLTSMEVSEALHRRIENSKDYFLQNGPVGARDETTKRWLDSIDVPSYFSGSLTLLLENPYRGLAKSKDTDLVVVDVPQDILAKNVPAEVLSRTKRLGFALPDNLKNSHSSRADFAYATLLRLSTAKLVMTSRLQVASAAAAVGASVVYVDLDTNVEDFHTSGSKSAALFHQVGRANGTNLDNFEWDNPPPNPGVNEIRRYQTTFWDTIRGNWQLESTARMYGVIPFDSLQGSSVQTEMWHLVQTSNNLNWRNIRTIESIFYHQPGMHLIIHARETLIEGIQEDVAVFREAGYTISVKSFDLKNRLEKIRDAFDENIVGLFLADFEEKSKGEFWFAHASDLFRLLLIYYEGGIYTDTDVIILKSFEGINNVIGVQDVKRSPARLNNAVYKFTESQNPFIKACIVEFLTNYNPRSWDYNGPGLVTRVFDRYRDYQCANNSACQVMSLPRSAFYPMHWKEIERLCFGNSTAMERENVEGTIANFSFAVHLNNHVTASHESLEKGTICKKLLNEFCVLCSRQY